MRNKNVAAVLLGTFFGVIAMLFVGFADEWANTPWQIPFSYDATPAVIQLEVQAVLLRTCHLMLTHGGTFIAVAILICLAFAHWSLEMPIDRGERMCLRTMWIFLLLETLTCVLGCLGGLVVTPPYTNIRALETTSGSWGFVAVIIGTVTVWLPLIAAGVSPLVELAASKVYDTRPAR